MKENLYSTVIENDYCIGCGACNYFNSNYKIELDKYGMYKASLDKAHINESSLASVVCPFSNDSKDEDQLAENLYKKVENKNTYLGKYLKNYVGYVNEGKFREKGSSGGFGKWILNELLEKEYVDYVIQLVSNDEEDNLFKYKIFKKGDDILSGSRSAYYPVTLKGVFDFIKSNEGRYVITAIPCFSKAIRNVCLHDEILANRIKFVIGVICGHLKSTGFAESLGWQMQVEPKKLRGIEFRDKIEGLKANEKGVYAIDEEYQKSEIMSSRKLFGGDWGYGFFKYKACDYCDDIVGETTDVSVGDAWIEELMSDYKGNNVLVIRNEIINNLVSNAISEKRLALEEVKEEVVVKSQIGGVRHRREGLVYRLYKKKKSKEWVPKKRFEQSKRIPMDRKMIYSIREELRDESHKHFLIAKKADNYSLFERPMKDLVRKLHKSFLIRLLVKMRNFYGKFKNL